MFSDFLLDLFWTCSKLCTGRRFAHIFVHASAIEAAICISLLPTLETAAVLGPYWFQSHFYDNCQNSCTLADWLVAIVCKSTDNKNDVRCNMHAFSMEYKANSMQTFPMLL